MSLGTVRSGSGEPEPRPGEISSESPSAATGSVKPKAYLSRLGGTGVVGVHPITPGVWHIGRDPAECTIVVPDTYQAAGRVHARLECDDLGNCHIRNCHKNGTYVDDELLQEEDSRRLFPGMMISLAGTRFSRPARCAYVFTAHPVQLPKITSPDDGACVLSENATILALLANPYGTGHLRLDEEVRAIDRVILSARNRDQLELRQCTALRASDLQEAVLRYTPAIVHFSGHGSASNGIVLSDDNGNPMPVSPAALSTFFAEVSPPVRCVILNACFSSEQGAAIADYVPCVIGMSRAISDKAAILFSAGFYRAIAYGQPVGNAFRLACSAIGIMQPLSGDARTPGRDDASAALVLRHRGAALLYF